MLAAMCFFCAAFLADWLFLKKIHPSRANLAEGFRGNMLI